MMPDHTHTDFFDNLARNVATLEADVMLESRPSRSTHHTRQPAVTQPAPRLLFGLTASVWLVLLTSFSLAGFCLYKHQTQERHFKVVTKPIAETQLGANLPGVNPLEADDLTFGAKVDPATWRAISLTGHQADGTLVEIQVLRPLSWIAEHNINVGSGTALDFGRIGVVGLLRVDSIHPCPTIRPGPGRTVTGIYRHHAHEVLTLLTENGEQIGLTPNHEIWSEDRQEFIATRDLRIGETLRLLTGTTRVKQLIPRRSGEIVYTLEVQVSHVFHVAKSGLLVHNCNWKSVKEFGHTFSTHGEGTKNTNNLLGRARGTNQAQGQWLNNQKAAEFLNGSEISGDASVRIPNGLGQVIKPDGSIVNAEWARVIFSPTGIRTAFPILPE